MDKDISEVRAICNEFLQQSNLHKELMSEAEEVAVKIEELLKAINEERASDNKVRADIANTFVKLFGSMYDLDK
ncbi:hypothetical protein Q5O89_16805 [Peribacillus frigoritolerans]|nr:hypothetical protein [Peribacillus frigoritolerans]